MKSKYKLAFMDMAERFACTSEAKRLKVGCLVVKNGSVISLGVNGTPSGWVTNECEDLNGHTSPEVLHAEIQALNKLRKSTESSSGASMFITHSCCLMCAINVVDAGITKVYYRKQYRDDSGVNYLKEHGIDVEVL